ncbi:TIGR03790 family protein [Lyngbya confervoides]|uniref:TIGR03790 family protein n=1 Tax=Lyngbya confervoides BDU141951 TaxID=1574623 RepID=A0ABD4T5L1_9CYAN|nr:TIGR03790 family protein [Lyngbya confervoides]MCM1983879.1 TIGR03790 family protein [Lyngbya confervoides BDU141951]
MLTRKPWIFMLVGLLMVSGMGILLWGNHTVVPDQDPPPPPFQVTLPAAGAKSCQRPPQVQLPPESWSAQNLALLVNDRDPQSVEVARYYQTQRRIPPQNLVHIDLPVDQETLSPAQFAPVYAQVQAALGTEIEAIALSFSQPIRVNCMSITSAFALGYDPNFCARQRPSACRLPQSIPTYQAASHVPFHDYGIRPTMMLAGRNIAQVKDLIDRGVRSDRSFPAGQIFLVHTTDASRSVRFGKFFYLKQRWPSPHLWQVQFLGAQTPSRKTDVLRHRRNILFYFTGLKWVPDLQTNRYLPGAIADHLTSLGGQLLTSPQMSILRWLEAGVTGSYGTVVEPCNYPQKFPDPNVLVPHYFQGETLLEAYWKSVASPQEGLFVGDPLAQPMGAKRVFKHHQLQVRLASLSPGQRYQLYGAPTQNQPRVAVGQPWSLAYPQVVQMTLDCRYPSYFLTSQAVQPNEPAPVSKSR